MSRKRMRFGLPSNPATPIIMIGPGTGIAPFRAFLHERMATKASGRNWLFFGHQRRDCDFFYEDELTGMKCSRRAVAATDSPGRATGNRNSTCRIACAKSAANCGPGSPRGAHLYVCGDGKRMAKDVERALVDITAQFGARSDRWRRSRSWRTSSARAAIGGRARVKSWKRAARMPNEPRQAFQEGSKCICASGG